MQVKQAFVRPSPAERSTVEGVVGAGGTLALFNILSGRGYMPNSKGVKIEK